MSMRTAIKDFCRYCQGLEGKSSLSPIYECRAHHKALSPDKTALEAAGGDCPLWPYRPGAESKRQQKPMTGAQRIALVEKLQAGRQAKLGGAA